MKLKVVTPSLGQKIISLKDESTLSQFVQTVKNAFEDKINITNIRFGYPTRKLVPAEDNDNELLKDLGINSGERVLLELSVTHKQSVRGAPATETSVQKEVKQINTTTQIEVGRQKILQIHTVPDDNSCLFHAISYALYKDISVSQQLREIVSHVIKNNKAEHSEAILGRPNAEYVEWIVQKSSWGGAIEISILSKYMEIAILTLDIDANRFEKFNDEKYNKFIMIVFSGIHYDVIEIFHQDSKELQTVFDFADAESDVFLAQALCIAESMKAAGMSFNTKRDKIRCNICGTISVGERDVARHVEATGHLDFDQAFI